MFEDLFRKKQEGKPSLEGILPENPGPSHRGKKKMHWFREIFYVGEGERERSLSLRSSLLFFRVTLLPRVRKLLEGLPSSSVERKR